MNISPPSLFHKTHPEQHTKKLQKQREWYRSNRERISAQTKSYRQLNKEEISQKRKAHYTSHRKKILEHRRAYRKANAKKINQQLIDYLKANPEKTQLYYQKRLRDPRYLEKATQRATEWYRTHRKAMTQQREKSRQTNPEEHTQKWRAVKYKINAEAWVGFLNMQDNRCAICFTPLLALGSRNTHLDHDHKTGLIRGILCRHCNSLLGQAKDNIPRLKSAIKYLQRMKRN